MRHVELLMAKQSNEEQWHERILKGEGTYKRLQDARQKQSINHNKVKLDDLGLETKERYNEAIIRDGGRPGVAEMAETVKSVI